MKLVVVGACPANVGKTSVVAGLVWALRGCPWTAVKLTQFDHGICSRICEPCACSAEDPDCFLQQAAEDGFPCYPMFAGDSNLNSLRDDPRFMGFMAKLKEQWEGWQKML